MMKATKPIKDQDSVTVEFGTEINEDGITVWWYEATKSDGPILMRGVGGLTRKDAVWAASHNLGVLGYYPWAWKETEE